jgi:hypothetical protein
VDSTNEGNQPDVVLINVEASDKHSHSCPSPLYSMPYQSKRTYKSYWALWALKQLNVFYATKSRTSVLTNIPPLLRWRDVSCCSNNGPQLSGDEHALSEHVNHAVRLPAAITVTALLCTYRPLIRDPCRTLRQGSALVMCPFGLNYG